MQPTTIPVTSAPPRLPNPVPSNPKPTPSPTPTPSAMNRFPRPPLLPLPPAVPSHRPALLETPPEWQRLPAPGGPATQFLPHRNPYNPHPQIVHPRHPFVRPPMQHPQVRHPFQQMQRPLRPLTYGEYRKMKEDYERRFMPQPMMQSPVQDATEMSSPDASSEMTQVAEDATHKPASAATGSTLTSGYSHRDPRRQPKEIAAASMPPDHSLVAAGNQVVWKK